MDVQRVVEHMRSMFGADYTRLVTDLAVARAELEAVSGTAAGQLDDLSGMVAKLVNGPDDAVPLVRRDLANWLATHRPQLYEEPKADG